MLLLFFNIFMKFILVIIFKKLNLVFITYFYLVEFLKIKEMFMD